MRISGVCACVLWVDWAVVGCGGLWWAEVARGGGLLVLVLNLGLCSFTTEVHSQLQNLFLEFFEKKIWVFEIVFCYITIRKIFLQEDDRL